MKSIIIVHPIHVDDTVFQAVNDPKKSDKGWAAVQSKIAKCMYKFKHLTSAHRLILSSKGTIIASNKKLAIAIQNELKSMGVHYKVVFSARDLGVSSAAFGLRPSKLLTHRLKSIKKRVQKIESLQNP